MPVSPESVRVVRVFVSSPGDVAEERAVLDEVVAAINRTDGQAAGFRLELFRWEEDVAPRIGPRAQKVIDTQTPVYDIYLGVMATRFGTPTGRYGSGTEQEFKAALRQWKRAGSPWIMFYFHDRPPISSDPAQVEQYLQVCQFRKELEALGLVGTYGGVRGSADGFYEQVSEHLRKTVRHLTSAALAAEPEPDARSSPPREALVDAQAAERAIYITGGQTTVVIQQNGMPSPSEQPVDPAPYLQALRDRTSHIDIRGLQVGSGRAPRFPIEELSIPLTTSGGAAPAGVHAAACPEGGLGIEYSLKAGLQREDSLKAELQRGERLEGRSGRVQLGKALQHERLVIVGDPGSGKTTLLRRIVYLLCDGALKQEGWTTASSSAAALIGLLRKTLAADHRNQKRHS